jgi:16S rRNA (cytosine967-C5)-methyltransferase
VTTAREVAARVLERVEREQAFASPVLDAELTGNVQLDARDRALATELVYGSLRALPWLMAQIARFAPRGTAKLDARVRAQLVVAAHQLFFTRVPAFAAVNEAVDAIRTARGPRMGAFANAVLRKLAVQATNISDAERRAAVFESIPAWLRDAVARSLGADEARAFLECGGAPPPPVLRVERAAERDVWVERLQRAAPHAAIEKGRVSPLAILVRGAGKPQRLPGWSDGAWSVQEEGSQVAALAVGAGPGETVLDACAGRGNKTAILARAVGSGGAVDACDAIPGKLDRLQADLERLGLSARRVYAVDWQIGSGDVEGDYDRILIDAPCSGVGTLRRRPEMALRRKSTDIADFARAQIAITARAADHLRPGGTLVYVVCSVLREECEEVIEGVRELHPELELTPFEGLGARAAAVRTAPEGPPAGSSFRLLPHVDGTDGYFVARLRSQPRTL